MKLTRTALGESGAAAANAPAQNSRSVPNSTSRARVIAVVSFLIIMAALYAVPLYGLAVYAVGTSLHSHVVLVPFISAYLLTLQGKRLQVSAPSYLCAFVFALFAAALLVFLARTEARGLSENDRLSVMALSFVLLLVGGGFALKGWKWMRAAALPAAFLLFMIPLPDHLVEWLETASKLASAEAAALLFEAAGVPTLRDGLFFQLPGITVEVAQECSGIRSSWVLFITSVLASQLFLKSPWRRLILVAFVIPLGVLRNGFRILVIGLLCVQYGPHMIDSVIHRQGGPVFFVLSLVPLFLLLAWLRSRETAAASPASEETVERQT